MALTKVTYSMIDGASINAQDYGAIGDGSNDDTAAIQAAINAASSSHQMVYLPIGKYKITSTLTVPQNGYLYMVGETGAATATIITPDYTKWSTLFFAPTGADDTLLDFGDNCYFNFERIFFVSDDDTQQWNAVSVGILGNYTSQTSSTSPFLISQCSFHRWGGTALSLGGETYGSIEHCEFDYCTQAIAVKGQGELTFYENHFQVSQNATFTPPANNEDAWIYIYQTVTRWDNNIFANTEDYRIWLLFKECTDVSFTGNKMEHPGRTALSYDQIQINNDSVYGRAMSFTQNAMTAPAATGTFAGRFLSTKGTIAIGSLVFCDNSATYGPAVNNDVPIIDVSVNKPLSMQVSGVYREAGDNATIKVANGAGGGLSTLLAGINSPFIKTVTYTTEGFTILAAQTGANCNFGAAGIMGRLITYAQLLPVLIEISTTPGTPGDTVSFYLGADTTKADKVTLASGDFYGQKIYPIRSDYINVPSGTSPQVFNLKYDSGASASLTTTYYVSFTYAVIDDPVTPSAGKQFITT